MNAFWRAYFAGRLAKPRDFLDSVRRLRDVPGAQGPPAQPLPQVLGIPRMSRTRLAMPEIMSSNAVLARHDRADWQQTYPELRAFVALFVLELRKMGIPFFAPTAFRTGAQQAALKAVGRSRATYPHAAHCQGAAVDLVHASMNWDIQPEEWELIGRIGKNVIADARLPIVWGGDWKGHFDPAHWEVAYWRDHVTSPIPSEPVRRTPTALHIEYKNSRPLAHRTPAETSAERALYVHPPDIRDSLDYREKTGGGLGGPGG